MRVATAPRLPATDLTDGGELGQRLLDIGAEKHSLHEKSGLLSACL
jgi:hypothetical protein